MDADILVTQLEIFPTDSKFNSGHGRKRRQQQITASAKAQSSLKTIGRPSTVGIGQRYGKLTVIEKTEERANGGGVVWMCRCDCGVEIPVQTGRLRASNDPLIHCGCLGVGGGNIPRPGFLGYGSQKDPRRVRNKPAVALNSLFIKYQCDASRRGIDFRLSKNEFAELVAGDCFFCGVAPRQVYKRGRNSYVYNGVDRIDSSGHYTIDNCVSCCGTCNIAKGEMSKEEFLGMAENIYLRHIKGSTEGV